MPDPSALCYRAMHLTLATRPARLAAAVVDIVVQLALLIPLQWMFGMFARFPRLRAPELAQTLLWMAIGFVIYLLVNGVMLAKSGQSLGKRALGIRIVDANARTLVPFPRLLLRRLLPQQLAGAVPGAGLLLVVADALCVFRADCRCLHDHSAGTLVVKVSG